MSCKPIKEPEGVYAAGSYVYNLKDIPSWFDYSIKNVMPANTLGSIYKVEKMELDLPSVLYCVHFDGFGYVNVKHCDLKLESM